jgi:hypothetical protein
MSHRGQPHRCARMARIGLGGHVDRKRADRVDAFPIRLAVRRLLVCHRQKGAVSKDKRGEGFEDGDPVRCNGQGKGNWG